MSHVLIKMEGIVREQGRPEQYIQLGPISRDEAEKRRIITLNDLLTGTYKRGSSVRLLFMALGRLSALFWLGAASIPK